MGRIRLGLFHELPPLGAGTQGTKHKYTNNQRPGAERTSRASIMPNPGHSQGPAERPDGIELPPIYDEPGAKMPECRSSPPLRPLPPTAQGSHAEEPSVPPPAYARNTQTTTLPPTYSDATHYRRPRTTAEKKRKFIKKSLLLSTLISLVVIVVLVFL